MSKIKFVIYILILIGFSPTLSAKKPQEKLSASLQVLPLHDQARFDFYFFESLKHKNLNQFDAQLEALRMCMSIDSLNGAVHYELGMLYTMLEKNTLALQSFKKSVRANPTNWWYQSQYISTLSALEKHDDAIKQALILKKIFPEKEEVYMLLAALYKQTGNFTKAIKSLDDLEVFTGIDEYTSFQKFQLYSALNKNSKAIAEIDRLIAKNPYDSRFQVLKGDLLMEKKETNEAFKIYQHVLDTDPSSPYVYIALSNYYKQQKNYDKAMDAIVAALKNPQLESETKMEILGQYVQKFIYNDEKLKETEGLFKILVEMYPLDEKAHFYYGLFLQHQKRNEEAISEFESVININTKNEQAWLNKLTILSEKQDTIEILKLTERALDELPSVAQFYFFRSIALYQQGKYQEAIKINEDALKNIDSSNPVVLSNFYAQMADIFYKMKEKQKAFDHYEKALSIYPSNIYVMNNYAYYLSEENIELRKAERMSAKTVEQDPTNSTYLDTYAWIFYKQKNFSLAKFYILKAIDNMENKDEEGNEVIYEHCGDIYYALGEKTKALAMWEKAYELGKKENTLKNKIENLKSNL